MLFFLQKERPADVGSPSSFQHQVAARKARDTAASENSNLPASTQPLDVDDQSANAAKRTSRRRARDVSYYYDDGEQRLKGLLERLESRGKRQPIDLIDTPGEYRDRLSMANRGRLLERQPRLPVFFSDRMSDGWYSRLGKRQPIDLIDTPGRYRDRY